MTTQPSKVLDWRTVKMGDVMGLTFSQLRALANARKREMPSESPPHIPEGMPAKENASAGPSVGSVGPTRTTRSTSKKSTPYTRKARDPHSLDVQRCAQKGSRPLLKKKSINVPSPTSSPEPEEADDKYVAASDESVEETLEMMRAMQRETEVLVREYREIILHTKTMRARAQELQMQLMAERPRNKRLFTYLMNWQQTPDNWTWESIFPRRDIILMTKTDEHAETTETMEVDLEDAETIPELKCFLDATSETPGNLPEIYESEITPLDDIIALGDITDEPEPGFDRKGKGKARVINDSDPERDFNADGKGLAKETNEPETESVFVPQGKGKGKARDVSFRPDVKQTDDTRSGKRRRSEKPMTREEVEYELMLAASIESAEKHSEEARHHTNLQASGSGSSGYTAGDSPHKRRKVLSEDENDTSSTPVDSTPFDASQYPTTPDFTWDKYGRPVISIPHQRMVSVHQHVTNIRRAVQFIEAGPPYGFVPEGKMEDPVRRATSYRKFQWKSDGTPDVEIPPSSDPEHVNKLLEAVIFLRNLSFGEDVYTKEESLPTLEHENSERTLRREGLRCSWTSDGFPVVTFAPSAYDNPDYLENILHASDFILRGPGPGEKWEGKDELPDWLRHHLPADPMVICTFRKGEKGKQPFIKLPRPTSPCYYDRIVIAAKFIRAEKEKLEQRASMAKGDAPGVAAELTSALAKGDRHVLNGITVAQQRALFRGEGMSSEDYERLVEGDVEEEIRAEVDNQVQEVPLKDTNEAGKQPERKPKEKPGKK